MARKALTELRYYPVDVNRVWDTKVRAVIRAKGFAAYYIYDLLLSLIYGDKGYYLAWTEDALMEVADCARCEEEEVMDILGEMLRRRLFDLDLFSQYSVLTSAGIQRRYLQAMKERVRRRSNERNLILPEYLLLEEKEIRELTASSGNIQEENGFLPEEKEFLPEERGFLPEESGFLQEERGFLPEERGFLQEERRFLPEESDKGKETKPKETERKPEQRRAEQTTDAPCGAPGAPAAPHTLRIGEVTLSQMEFEALSSRYGREQVEAKAAHLDAWMKDNGRAVTSCFATLRAWLSSDAVKERQRQRAAAQPAVGKRTGAHNFTQRVYTDEELDALFPTDLDRLREGP